jgi:glyoxylase-like metal-dependent hydrolase (beta-lactamase superfamily II)
MAALRIEIVPVRSPTLPPATHTNVVLLGEGALTVVDPASPWEDEQGALWAALGDREVQRIVLTHHHPDHVSGARALAAALAERGRPAPIVAHAETARLLVGCVPVDQTIAAGDALDCAGRAVEVLHTPGHAAGHVVLLDPSSGRMVAGDMVAGVGTILIDPAEGDLGDYLDALARMAERAPTALIPSHGPVLDDAPGVLAAYIAHRHMRTEQILGALRRHGPASARDVVPHVYPDLDPSLRPIAAMQATAHLRWMAQRGWATSSAEGVYEAV